MFTKRKTKAYNRALALIPELPADCKRAAVRAMHVAEMTLSNRRIHAIPATSALIASVHRVAQRRDSDKATDQARRKLVGARVPLADYERFKAAAAAQSLSLYQWTRDALETAAAAQADEAAPVG